MRSLLKRILIAFASLLGLVLAGVLVLPETYRVERSLLVRAPAEAVYAQVARPERWREWAPWNEARYPGGEWTFGGAQAGTGAVRSWRGGAAGQGTLLLSEADPGTGVTYQASLDEGRSTARGRISWTPVEGGGGTQVVWVDEGRLGGHPLRRYLLPLVRARLGEDLEAGLGRLKTVVEQAPPPSAEPEPVPTPVPVSAPLPDAGSAPPSPVAAAPSAPAPSEPSPDAGPARETVAATADGGTPPAPEEVAVAPAPPPAPAPSLEGEAVPAGPGDAGAPR